MNKQAYTKPKKLIEADNKKDIWCPFCDWHMSDNYTNRRRIGIHLVNEHYDDVAYVKGEQPEPID